jgi:rhomboid protease GluP
MRIKYNAPVSLTFTLAAGAVFLLSLAFPGINEMAFVVRGNISFQWGNIGHWLGIFSHILGHGDWDHYVGNFTFILLLGPILEEKYGLADMIFMILVTTFVVGLSNAVFFANSSLGASGIVFMMIILASVTNISKGDIPITLLIVAAIFIGKEIANSMAENNVNEFAHIIGGVSGGILGLIIGKPQEPGEQTCGR